MLLNRVKQLNKNHICFEHNKNIYYDEINNDVKLDVFNLPLINVYLNK